MKNIIILAAVVIIIGAASVFAFQHKALSPSIDQQEKEDQGISSGVDLDIKGEVKPQENNPSKNEDMVACTMEAKLCPDGKTYVGRSGPKCEFAACPGN